jgi:hypothetical protein
LRSGLCGLSIVVSALVAPSASAESRLVLAQPVVPELMPVAALRETVVHIAEGLVNSGLDVSVDPFPAGVCNTPPCLVDMARAHSAVAVVQTEIAAEGRNYRIKMRLIDGRNGQIVEHIEVPCNFCAYDELGEASTRAARQLVARTRRQHGSNPPLQLEPRGSALGARLAPWVAVGAGVALVVTGLFLVSADGCGTRNADGSCPAATHTKWLGATTMSVGALLAGAGGTVLLFTAAPDARGHVVGAGAAVRWVF